MTNSNILAEGSIKGFLTGTHFNRSKKLHVVVATAFKKLQFEAFFHKYMQEDHDERLHKVEIIETLEDDKKNPANIDRTMYRLQDLLKHYSSFIEETVAGSNGRTAQFISIYIQFIEYYLNFERSIRTSDVNLYIYSLYKIGSLFFTFNHFNYARWISKYLDQLVNLSETNPDILAQLGNGALSVRRTAKNFCRSAVDLTLEQTVNANAANKLTGISSFTNSISARQKWSETHSIRTEIVTHLLETLNLVQLSDGVDEYNNKIFDKTLKKFEEELNKNINPFSEDINHDKIFNLNSGRAASTEVTEFLVNVESNGLKQLNTFITECHEDATRFEKPIKNNTIKNFPSDAAKCKKSNRKCDETKVERNILGKILCLSLDNEVNLRKVLSYPLARIPHAFAHFEDFMLPVKQKGELTTLLISRVSEPNETQTGVDVEIIDGFHLLGSIKEAPMKYGELANFVLRKVCNTEAHEIHVIFDRLSSHPSPRDTQIRKFRELYENSSINFQINGPNQERNCSLSKCMLSDSFKEELVKFFIRYWKSDEADMGALEKKKMFLSFGEDCYLFSTNFNIENGKILSSFHNDHFEVESKIILHMYKIRAKRIYIKTSNVDAVLVYSLYHMQFWKNEKDVWIQTGDVNKKIQVINVREVYDTLSPALINALPGWCAFTGCGCVYEPSFYGKGTKSCMKTLEKNIEFQTAFGDIGKEADVKNEVAATLQKFTCQLYGSNSNDINDVRLSLFQKSYGSHSGIDFSMKGKVF